MKFRSLEPNDASFPKSYKNKKWRINLTLDNGRTKTIYIGDKRYEDYTQHGDSQRRANYLNRHQKTEDWNNILSPGAWSRYLLWGPYKTITENLAYVRNKFRI
jgi:hypothetical protein